VCGLIAHRGFESRLLRQMTLPERLTEAQADPETPCRALF
jgi:hypothetical protein